MNENIDNELQELRAQYQLLTEKLKAQNIISDQAISDSTKEHILGLRKKVRDDWKMPLVYLSFPVWIIPMVLLLTVPISITIGSLLMHHEWPDYSAYFADLMSTESEEWQDIMSPQVWYGFALILVYGVYYLIWVIWESTMIGRLERMLCDGSTAAEIGRYAKDVYRQFHNKRLVWIHNIFLIIMAVLFLAETVWFFGIDHFLNYFWIGFILITILMIPRSLKRVQACGYASPMHAVAPFGRLSRKRGMDYYLLQIIRETEGINEGR